MNTRRAIALRSLLSVAGLATPFGLASPVDATVLSWINAGGGSAGLGTNWNPAQVPVAADLLNFNINGTYGVTFPASVPASAQQNFNAGSVFLTMTAPHTVSSQVVLGLNAGTTSFVSLGSGSLRCNGIVALGSGPGSSGTLAITGTGQLNLGGSFGLRVGSAATGALNLSAGGRITQVAGAGGIQVGALAGSSGTLTLQNPTTQISLADPVTGDLTVGVNGPGSMSVLSGAEAVVGHTLSIAPNAGITGAVGVAGGSAEGHIDVLGDVHVAHNTSAAAAGTGALNVNSGSPASGRVTVGGTTFVGDPNGGSGTLSITDGSFVTRNLVIDPLNGHLSHTGGNLLISAGGSFTTPGSTYAINGPGPGPTLHFQGSTGIMPGGFVINHGTLEIESGAHVSTAASGSEALNVGVGAGNTGAILLFGAGSRLELPSTLSAPQALQIGSNALGTLSMSGGAVLDATTHPIRLAANLGSTATAMIASGSTLTTTSSLAVGGSFSQTGGAASLFISGSSSVNCSAFRIYPGSTLSVDDSTVTVSGAGVNTAELRGTVTLANAGEVAADVVLVSGSVQGNGNLYGDVTIQPGGTVTASGGDLFVGSSGNGNNGFVNQGTLDVGAAVVHIQDGNASPAGDTLIQGGQLFATELSFAAGDSLSGHGGINSAIAASGATFAISGGDMVFNGPVSSDETSTWTRSVTSDRVVFAAGGGFTGRGAIGMKVATEEEAAITATGQLDLGDHSVSGAIALNGPLHIGAHSVVLASDSPAQLGVLTTINGGTLDGPADRTRTVVLNNPFGQDLTFVVHDAVPIVVPSGGLLQGTGTISHKLAVDPTATVTLTGPMTATGSGYFNSSNFPLPSSLQFVPWFGTTNIGPHTLTFTSSHRISGDVFVSGGAVGAPGLGSTGMLSGHGSIIGTAVANNEFRNGGVLSPGGAAIGQFSMNCNLVNRFALSSGFFPSFAPGTLEMDLSGDQGFAHDELIITQGDAELYGTLTVRVLDAEPAPGQLYTIVHCDNGGIIGTFETVNLPPLASGFLRVRYTANEVQIVVMPPCLADFNLDGNVNPDDLGDYITCFFTTPPCPDADFNADGNIDPDDLGDFITTFFGPAC